MGAAAEDRQQQLETHSSAGTDTPTSASASDVTRRRQVAVLAQQFEKGVFTSDTSVKRALDVQEQGKRSFDSLKGLMQKLRVVVDMRQAGLLDEVTLGIDTLEIQWRRKEIYLKEAIMEARKAAEEFRDVAEHMDREVKGLKGAGGLADSFRAAPQLEPTYSLRDSMPSLGHVGELRRRWSLSDMHPGEGSPQKQQAKTRSTPIKEVDETESPATPQRRHLQPQQSSPAYRPRSQAAEAEILQLRNELTRLNALLSLREGELQQLRTSLRASTASTSTSQQPAPPQPPPEPSSPPSLSTYASVNPRREGELQQLRTAARAGSTSQAGPQQPSQPPSPTGSGPGSPKPRTLTRLLIPNLQDSHNGGRHQEGAGSLQVEGSAALGETLQVAGVPLDCPPGTVQWCRITEDGQQEPIALATSPQYAPEPDDVGRPLGAIVRRDWLEAGAHPDSGSTPLLSFVAGPGPVQGTPGLVEYASQMAASGWGAFNCIVVSCNGSEAERRRGMYTLVVMPEKVKLQHTGKTRWKQEFHAGMQVAGARGPGENAAQAAYICFKPTLSFMLAFENSHERNAFLVLVRKMAEQAGVKLGAPSYDMWGPL